MFLAPWFLLGLLGVAVPLVIHLRRSRRSQRIIFSTTRFFDEQFMRASRQARLQDRLMMLLRMLLVALLAMAMAQPLLRLPDLAGLTGGGRTVAIVIDDSASMNLVTDRGSVLEQAKAAAMAVVDELSPSQGDRATIILAGLREPGPRVLFEKPTDDLASLKAAIQQLTPTDLGSDLAQAVAAAGKTVAPPPGSTWNKSREVYVISDMQPCALVGPASLHPGRGTGLYLVSLAVPSTLTQGNVSIDALQYDAPQPMVDVPFTFRVMAVNHAPEPAPVRIELVMDDQVVTHQSLTLEPARATIVRMDHRFTSAGWHSGHVQIVPEKTDRVDPLPADDRRYFALPVLPGLKILAINGSPSAVASQDELFFLRLALTAGLPSDASAPAQRIEMMQITPEQVTPERLADFPMIILANVPDLSPAVLQALEHHIDQGAGLLITLGDRTRLLAFNAWASPARLHHGLPPSTLQEISTAPAHIMDIAPNHPALAGFALQRLGQLSAATFSKRFTLNPASDSRGLLLVEQDAPLLIEKSFGRGRVMLYATSIDRDWNDLPLQPAFVPWVHRLTSYLGQETLGRAGFIQTGQQVNLPLPVTQTAATAVEQPDHSVVYPQREQGSHAASALPLVGNTQAGIYRVRTDGEDEPSLLFAANIPAGESTLQPINAAAMAPYIAPGASWVFIDDPSQLAQRTRIARQGTGLWEQLLFIALFIAVFEPWLANRWSRWRSSSKPLTPSCLASS